MEICILLLANLQQGKIAWDKHWSQLKSELQPIKEIHPAWENNHQLRKSEVNAWTLQHSLNIKQNMQSGKW